MSGISSCIDAIKLINSDKQTPDEDARFELRCVTSRVFDDDGTFTDESREVVYRGPEELGDEETRETA
jgi:hypothetical protein